MALADYPVLDGESYVVRDLLTDRVYTWRGAWNFVRLDPDVPAHIFYVSRPVVTDTVATRTP
jgi:starch synthase (maltosyl-transferring)